MTPGHTPECMTHVIGNAAFVGDTLFMPDGGTARADFPGGDPNDLYNSIKKILSLPENTKIFVCHDYMPDGREAKWESTVKEQKEHKEQKGVSQYDESSAHQQQPRQCGLRRTAQTPFPAPSAVGERSC